MAEDDDRRLADEAIVVRVEQPPERRLDLQDLEVVARDEQPLPGHRLAVEGHVRAEGDVRRDAGEHRLHLLQVAEHRVAEDGIAVPGLPARLRSRLRPRRRQVDELRRPRHVQRLEQHLVEAREDRRIGADPERQRHDGDDRDKRGLEQGPEGELEAAHWGVGRERGPAGLLRGARCEGRGARGEGRGARCEARGARRGGRGARSRSLPQLIARFATRVNDLRAHGSDHSRISEGAARWEKSRRFRDLARLAGGDGNGRPHLQDDGGFSVGRTIRSRFADATRVRSRFRRTSRKVKPSEDAPVDAAVHRNAIGSASGAGDPAGGRSQAADSCARERAKPLAAST